MSESLYLCVFLSLYYFLSLCLSIIFSFMLLCSFSFLFPLPVDYFSLFLKSVYISLSGCVKGLRWLGNNEEKGLIAEAPGASWRLGELGRRVLPPGWRAGCLRR